MTDEQAMRQERARQWLDSMCDGHMHEATNVIALLDAKDAELREYKEALAFTESERDTALSRAEQAERERDEAREQFDAHVVWASDQLAQADAALAEERKAREAIQEAIVEVSARAYALCSSSDAAHITEPLKPIMPAKPDPLRKLAVEMVLADGVIRTGNQEQAIRDGRAAQEAVAEHERRLRAAIERAGGTISFERNG